MNNEKFKQIIISLSLLATFVLMFWGAITPPPGEISSSIIMCGEIMIFILTILGVSDMAIKFMSDINEKLTEYKEIHNSIKNEDKA